MGPTGNEEAAGIGRGGKRPRSKRESEDNASATRSGNQGIDHAEEAEESLVGIALSSFFQEANLPGVTKDSLEECLERLRLTVQSIPEGDVDSKHVKNVLDVFRFSGMKNKFRFRPPKEVSYIGMASIGAVSKYSRLAAMGVKIPSDCFDEKDYLNHRYFSKRLLYLSHMLTHLRKHKKKLGMIDIGWHEELKDPRKPCVSLIYEDWPDLRIVLWPVLDIELFPINKLSPERNNIRTDTSFENNGDPKLAPTPIYNASIIEDMFQFHNASVLRGLTDQFPCFGQVATLLVAWARNHGLMEGSDGVTEEFLLEVLKTVLEDTQMIYSSQWMHLFRSAILFISREKQLDKRGIFQENSPVPGLVSAAPSKKCWRQAGMDVIFIDSTGWINAAIGISAAALSQTRSCALKTAEMLAKVPGPDTLYSVFMTCADTLQIYDEITCCTISKFDENFEKDETAWRRLEKATASIAKQALGNRARMVRVVFRPYRIESKKESIIKISPSKHQIFVCCILEPDHAFRTVDIGPAANDKAANAFREFWGNKSQLRRFQDGKIAETLLWKNEEYNRHNVVSEVLTYALSKHQGFANIVSSSSILDDAISRKGVSQQDDLLYQRACIQSVSKLAKVLKSLDGLTLSVVHAQPVSSVIRHASVFPPRPHPLAGNNDLNAKSNLIPRCLDAIEIFCQLEGSGKWPDGPVAYKKMKAAIGVQLAKALKAAHGLDSSASEEYIDVMMNGFVFRLRLYSERDFIIQEKTNADNLDGIPPEDNITLRQSHQGFISALAAQYPALESSIRLAKFWIARQWLGNHICEEAVELLTAAAFTSHIGLSRIAAPACHLAGFLGFLHIIADYAWDAQPLVLDSSITEEAGRLYVQLKKYNKAAPMSIAIGKDEISSEVEFTSWTKLKPSKSVLFRARSLASKSINAIHSYILKMDLTPDNLSQKLFSHTTKDYEIIVQFRKDALPNSINFSRYSLEDGERVRKRIRREDMDNEARQCRTVLHGIPKDILHQRGEKAIKKELLTGFDPVEIFCIVLEERYSSIAVVCRDTVGSQFIGLKLKPKMMEPRSFDPDANCSVMSPCLDLNDKMVHLDLAALAQDILELGAGLVASVNIFS